LKEQNEQTDKQVKDTINEIDNTIKELQQQP
jgi:bacterioferritin-associated ferredoxin